MGSPMGHVFGELYGNLHFFSSLDGWCPINIAIKKYMVHLYPVYGKDYRPGYMDNIWIHNPVYII